MYTAFLYSSCPGVLGGHPWLRDMDASASGGLRTAGMRAQRVSILF